MYTVEYVLNLVVFILPFSYNTCITIAKKDNSNAL